MFKISHEGWALLENATKIKEKAWKNLKKSSNDFFEKSENNRRLLDSFNRWRFITIFPVWNSKLVPPSSEIKVATNANLFLKVYFYD